MYFIITREKSSESEANTFIPARSVDRSQSPPSTSGGGAQESLSIEETNKLRAKLGLKPLEQNEKPAGVHILPFKDLLYILLRLTH